MRGIEPLSGSICGPNLYERTRKFESLASEFQKPLLTLELSIPKYDTGGESYGIKLADARV